MASTNEVVEVKEKRVACLYRVSTKGQMEKDDIPMQKRACREFIEKQVKWKLVKEYSEKGVSGYRVAASKRDELQRAKVDAEAGLYDVLLVFMFDRLGRREDETPFVVEWFTRQGVEVWSTQEGEQRFDTHVDKLMNYIRYWQSSGESQKTSMRVSEKHRQMVKDGEFRGGKPPYGFHLSKTGVVNKKGKELLGLEIDKDESKVVKEMFDLVYLQGYGGVRIAKYLNQKDIPPRYTDKWSLGVVNYILRNPIYKGYMAYDKTTSLETGLSKRLKPEDWILSDNQIEKLIIIEEDVWDKVQVIRASRAPNMTGKKGTIDDYNLEKSTVPNGTTKSPLLFVGRIKCGYCGSPLTTTYHYKSWTNKDGSVHKKLRPKYRCSGKALGKGCEGQTVYAQDRIETTVLDEVKKYLEELKKVDMTTQINKFKKSNMDEDSTELKNLHKQLEDNYEELNALMKEVSKSIMGKSSFKPELLQSIIEEKESEVQKLNNKISIIDEKLKSKNVEVGEMQLLQKYIPIWESNFDDGTIENKKVMLNLIISKVTVFKDYIDVSFKINISNFVSNTKLLGLQNKRSWEYNYVSNTTPNSTVIEKLSRLLLCDIIKSTTKGL